jgi:hypothetical protein
VKIYLEAQEGEAGQKLGEPGVKNVSYVARSVMIAERETHLGVAQAIHGLMQGTTNMSRYQYLAHLVEVSTEIAQAKKVSADEIFKTLAALPRDKVQEQIRGML